MGVNFLWYAIMIMLPIPHPSPFEQTLKSSVYPLKYPTREKDL
jgi:hypothetical protein